MKIAQGNRFMSTLEMERRVNLLGEDTMISFLMIREIIISEIDKKRKYAFLLFIYWKIHKFSTCLFVLLLILELFFDSFCSAYQSLKIYPRWILQGKWISRRLINRSPWEILKYWKQKMLNMIIRKYVVFTWGLMFRIHSRIKKCRILSKSFLLTLA